jgi:hypothetical protein
MTLDDDFIGQLEGNLEGYLGITPLASCSPRAIRAELPGTRQIGPMDGPMRDMNMTMKISVPVRYGLVAAAVVVLAVVGIGVLIPRGGVGGLEATPTASELPSPTAPPVSAAPVPTNAGGSGTLGPYGGTAAPAGTYFIQLKGYRYTFTVPTAGWWTNYYGDLLVVGKVHGDNGPMTRLFLLSDDGGEVFADACYWRGTNSIPGVTVDDLVAALAAIDGFEASEVSDTMIGGHSAKHLRLTVPADVNLPDCDDGRYEGYPGFADITPGRVQDFWVFDADGTRHLIWSAFDGDTSFEAQADLTQLISSLEIEPLTP